MKRRLKDEEDLISSDPSVGAVPEIVADRMIGRIAAFFGYNSALNFFQLFRKI
jgi:hypothetical protein